MDTVNDRKVDACLVLLVMTVLGIGWADWMLARVESRVTVSDTPIVTRWVDENGLEQSRAAIRLPGESDEILNARLQESVNVALKFFPCKERVR